MRGVGLGAKNVTFCPDLPGVTFTKYNMAPKRRTVSKIESCLVLARWRLLLRMSETEAN